MLWDRIAMPAAVGQIAVALADFAVAVDIAVDVGLKQRKAGQKGFSPGIGQRAILRIIAQGQKQAARIGEGEHGARRAGMLGIEEEAGGLFFACGQGVLLAEIGVGMRIAGWRGGVKPRATKEMARHVRGMTGRVWKCTRICAGIGQGDGIWEGDLFFEAFMGKGCFSARTKSPC